MFFPSAKILIHHPTDKSQILLIKRNVHGVISYEPAGGRSEIDYDTLQAESLEECVIREAAEELGMNVKVEKYIGSYSYFWPHDQTQCSSYAVFTGSIVENIPNFTGNGDKDCWPIEPEWVTVYDIVHQKKILNATHHGLKPIIMNYLQSL